nr:MAG TPA: hypothetical protein [Caudoviricetes sp.]
MHLCNKYNIIWFACQYKNAILLCDLHDSYCIKDIFNLY